MRIRAEISVTLAALVVPAAPASVDSPRVETATGRGATGARVVYVGDARDNRVEIRLARNEDIDLEAPDSQKAIGFLVTGASPSLACGSGRYEGGRSVGRDGVRLLAPRAYARTGNDSISIHVPRRAAVVYGGARKRVLLRPLQS